MMPYERFMAWKAADELAFQVYRATAGWPKGELYGLTGQIRRAAVSVPINLAEGSAKMGPRDFAKFVDIAIGSLSEVAYILRFARRVGYLTQEDHDRLQALRNRTGQLTWKLLQSLRRAS